jgi:hypothetical protein
MKPLHCRMERSTASTFQPMFDGPCDCLVVFPVRQVVLQLIPCCILLNNQGCGRFRTRRQTKAVTMETLGKPAGLVREPVGLACSQFGQEMKSAAFSGPKEGQALPAGIFSLKFFVGSYGYSSCRIDSGIRDTSVSAIALVFSFFQWPAVKKNKKKRRHPPKRKCLLYPS